MKRYLENKTMIMFISICTIFILLTVISGFNVCYAIEDKIDESKLNGYYLEMVQTETNNRFINGYGIIQNRYGYSTSTKFGLIDKNYKVVLEPDTYFQIIFDERDQNIIYCYIDPYFRYGDVYKITDKGLVKITKQMYYFFDSQFNYFDMISARNKDGEYGIINRDGNTVLGFSKEYLYHAYGSFIVRYNILSVDSLSNPTIGNAELLNEKGEVLTNSQYDNIYIHINYTDSKFDIIAIEVTKGEKRNLLNLNNYTEALDWSYKAFRDYKGYIVAKNSLDKWGLLDKNFQTVVDFDYENIIVSNDTLYWYRNGIKEVAQLPEDKPKTQTTINLTAKLPTFDITLNGVKIDNSNRLYPFIVYNDITYFPMTYYDSRFLNLRTEWDPTTGLKVLKGDESSGYITDNTKTKHPTTMKPTLAEFHIQINGKEINNLREPYPLLLYKNVTYFPMTWRFGVDEFGWDYRYTNEKGLVINSK